jgi:MFS family permease
MLAGMSLTSTSSRTLRYDRDHPRYKWIALSNTTLGMLLATVNASIVIISLPAIFRGIRLNPLAPGNVSYLLWMIMGFLLVSAVLVVPLGKLGDMYGRVRLYSLGFAVFTAASIALSLDPWTGAAGAWWLLVWRVVQGVGGSMIFANSTAILTDAFPARQRGMALGINQVAAIAGSFIGLVLGGLLAEWHWRAVFWISVPLGVLGVIWSYRSLHELGERRPGRLDRPGILTFAAGLGILLTAITYGIQPYGGHSTGWANPWVLGGLAAGVALLVAFCLVERRSADPMFHLDLFRSPVFAAGNLAGFIASIGRGGLQFMLIIWLQGIWLPLHGYDFAATPLWAGIYLLPLTVGFVVAGPVSGWLSDRFGVRLFAVTGMLVVAATFVGLVLLPVDFPYWLFATLVALNGLGSGLFTSPNTSAVMGAVPADQRGAAAGMRGTFLNSGQALAIGIFFSLMVLGLAAGLPGTLSAGLRDQGVPADLAARVGALPPVGTLFAAFLGVNPIGALLGPTGVLSTLPPDRVATLTGRQFFPHLISGPFHHGLVVVFVAAAAMTVVGALASLVGDRRAETRAGAARGTGTGDGTTPGPVDGLPTDRGVRPLPAPRTGQDERVEQEPADVPAA